MSYVSEVLADSPLLYWRFGEGSGLTAADTSGNGRTGTYSGAGITYGATGALGASGDTNTAVTTVSASSGHIDSTASLDLSALSVISVECWMKTTFTAGDNMLTEFSVVNWSIENGTFVIDPNAGSDFQIGMRSAGQRLDSFTPRPSNGVYHHYVFVLNIGTGDITAYVDSVSQSLTVTGSATSGTFGNIVLRVASRAGTSLFLDATLDEYAIYGSALSQARVSAHYNAALTNPTANLAPVIYGRGAC